MARRNPPAKWTLPIVIDPPDHICFTIPVPNDIHHIGAFYGAIFNLTSARFWQDDTTHTALLVAKVWQNIFYNLTRGACELTPENIGIDIEDCDMNLRIKPTDPCVIQIRCGEDEWKDWYDPRSCIPGLVTQPEPAGGLAAGDCATYSVTLQANNVWRSPVSVAGNYQVTISNVKGAANDGGSTTWYCPNGQPFVLGFCVGAAGHAGGDPDAVSYHMQLIGYDGTNYYGAYNTSFFIPPAVADTYLEFQLNDVDLTDNRGSVSFDVEICNKNANLITHTFDFTTGPHGWTFTDDGGGTATYVPGSGFKSNNPTGTPPDGAMTLTSPAVGQFTIVDGNVIYIATAANTSPTSRNIAFNKLGALVIQGNLVNASGTVTTPLALTATADNVLLTVDSDAMGTNTVLQSVTFVVQATTDPWAGL